MSGKFLQTLFRVVDLPPAIIPEVLSRYASRYADYLAYNRSLGDAGARLVSKKLSVDALEDLVSSGNRAVFDAVLSGKESRHRVLAMLLWCWELSLEDQRRFINRSLRPTTRELLGNYNFSREIVDLVDDDIFLEEDALLGPEEVAAESVLRDTWGSLASRFDWRHDMEAVLSKKVWALGANTDVCISAVCSTNSVLTSYLGTGSTHEELRSWMLFLNLTARDPDVPLESVLKTARLLARTEVLCTA